jgi:hypothetical protein
LAENSDPDWERMYKRSSDFTEMKMMEVSFDS